MRKLGLENSKKAWAWLGLENRISKKLGLGLTRLGLEKFGLDPPLDPTLPIFGKI